MTTDDQHPTAPTLAYSSDNVSIWYGDILDVLPRLESASVSLIVADPPYHRVKGEAWDRQWKTDGDYLAWIGRLCEGWKRVLKANGSLYCFASPRMAARVEVEIGKWFDVLNQIRWDKPNDNSDRRHVSQLVDKDIARSYYPSGERIIFAEHRGSDEAYNGAIIAENSDYFTACERVKRGIFGDYLRAEFRSSGVTNRDIAALFPSASGGLTGCVSNWLLGYNCPTQDQYEAIRRFLNLRKGESGYLRREYEDLRREYEDLRREYEDLRRPFFVTADVPYTDVWDFPTISHYPGKHPCEKPASMMEHIINTSSCPSDIVLDPFCGSGVVPDVCRSLGRRCIAAETNGAYIDGIRVRLDGAPMPLFDRAEKVKARAADTAAVEGGGKMETLLFPCLES